ncbi:ATP-binding protein [Streptomyces deccanensis]|uniref:ATP-binding protein n=1 Tax=Streptomyces deccanensis TaxID=424188 RepID=UPI001EFBF3FE|nr:tetratricopeptide repeat protein [Streptomyces deccanensis]ULR51883.1 tetratricopeptide repeat protein [Streptomyces deccanensis]
MSGAADRFWGELRRLYEAAGEPPLSRLVKLGKDQRPPLGVGLATIDDWLTGKAIPGQRSERYFKVLIAFLQARVRQEVAYQKLSEGVWLQMLIAARRERSANQGGRPRTRTVQGPRDAPMPTSGPVSLPPDPVGFTGRSGLLEELLVRLAPQRPQHSPVISAIVGMGGAGKTALAVHAAHEARKHGWFPGGILFADLYGYSPSGPQEAGTTAEHLLRALGVADAVIPPTSQGKLDLWRVFLDRLAESESPLLMVLDNAAAAGHVSPLLPGPPHRVIVTSRHNLSALSAHRVELTALPIDEAVELLQEALRATHSEDNRISAHPADAKRLAMLCGRLPLALHIIAALLRDEPDRPLGDQIADLSDARMRMEILQYDDVDEQGRPLSVRAAFDLSYRQLSSDNGELARAFRLLALTPGPEISTETAAALLDRPAVTARRLMVGLTRAHLLEKRQSERWGMHDLIRIYADEHSRALADHDQRKTAIMRLLDHLLSSTRAANSFLEVATDEPVADRFADRYAAVSWLDNEHDCLVAAVTLAEDEDLLTEAALLSLALGVFLNWRRHVQDWLYTAQVAVRATEATGNRHGLATALNNLGLVLRHMRRFDEAIDAHRQAVAIFQELGERQREGGVLHNLGLDLQDARRFDEATETYQQAVQIFREMGDQLEEQKALDARGVALQGLRNFTEAAQLHRRAAFVFHEFGNLPSEASALTNLGVSLMELFLFEESLDAHHRAEEIFEHLDDQYRRATALDNQGTALQGLQDFSRALNLHQQASETFRRIGDQHRLGGSLDNQGTALYRLGRFHEALHVHQEAEQIFGRFGDGHRRARATGNCGASLLKLQRYDESVDTYRKAAGLYKAEGDPYGEAHAMGNLAIAHNERWRSALR